MPSYKLLSSDSHVIEPADLWEKRIDPRFKDRAPRLVHEEHTDQWYADGDIKFGAIAVAGQAGQRFEDPSKLTSGGRYEDLPPAGYDPHAHVKDMDLDGVAGGVMYPSPGETPSGAYRPPICFRPSFAPTTTGWPTSASLIPTASKA